jgi:hypothetical protein
MWAARRCMLRSAHIRCRFLGTTWPVTSQPKSIAPQLCRPHSRRQISAHGEQASVYDQLCFPSVSFGSSVSGLRQSRSRRCSPFPGSRQLSQWHHRIDSGCIAGAAGRGEGRSGVLAAGIGIKRKSPNKLPPRVRVGEPGRELDFFCPRTMSRVAIDCHNPPRRNQGVRLDIA